MAKLNAEKRNKIPSSEFGLPKSRKYPMEDREHAAKAKGRASEMEHKGKISKSTEKKIDAKANKKLGEKQSAEHKKTGYMGKDSREGRLKEMKTDRGSFRMKENRKGE